MRPDKEWPGEWLGPPRVFRFFSSFFLFFRFLFFPGYLGAHWCNPCQTPQWAC